MQKNYKLKSSAKREKFKKYSIFVAGMLKLWPASTSNDAEVVLYANHSTFSHMRCAIVNKIELHDMGRRRGALGRRERLAQHA